MAWPRYLHDYMRELERAESWRDFERRFMELAREEQGRADVITKGETLRRMDKLLRASCNYQKHPEVWVNRENPEQRNYCLLETPPHGIWNYCSRGISENFFERVRLCVAEAGRALPDYPKGTDPEDFWLHQLYLDLLRNNSDLLFCGTKEGGMILSVCVASATFCARLERRAIQQSEPGGQRLPSQPIEPSTLETTEGPRPVDQDENLRNAILAKKARIAEIERTLDRPPLTEYRGQPVHGGQNWRLQLEEERQHLIMAVKELEAEQKLGVFSPAQNTDKTANGEESKPASGMTRKAVLMPLLTKNNFSVHDWARQAGVDWHTADDYLNGKTKPYQSTLGKLAAALKAKVEDMPA